MMVAVDDRLLSPSRGVRADQAQMTKGPDWSRPNTHTRRTWRLVVAKVFGAWRWAVLREWHSPDGQHWICMLEWSEDATRGGAQSAWFVYDPAWIHPAPAPPPDWPAHVPLASGAEAERRSRL
jgi:hypothetical protein